MYVHVESSEPMHMEPELHMLHDVLQVLEMTLLKWSHTVDMYIPFLHEAAVHTIGIA